MHDDGAAQHGLFADQLDEAVLDAAFAVAVGVGFEVAEIADMAGFVTGGTVWWGLLERGCMGLDCEGFVDITGLPAAAQCLLASWTCNNNENPRSH